MEDRSPLSPLIRGFLLVMLIDLVVIALITMLGWWLAWMYLESFQRAIWLAGTLVIGIGLVPLLRDLLLRRRSHLEDGRSQPLAENGDQTSESLQSWLMRHAFPVVFITAGGVCLLIGFLLV